MLRHVRCSGWRSALPARSDVRPPIACSSPSAASAQRRPKRPVPRSSANRRGGDRGVRAVERRRAREDHRVRGEGAAADRRVSAPWTGAKAVRRAFAYTDAVFVTGVTAEGMRLTPSRFEDRYGNGMGCGPVWTRDHVDRMRFENGWLVPTTAQSSRRSLDRSAILASTRAKRLADACDTERNGVALCRCLARVALRASSCRADAHPVVGAEKGAVATFVGLDKRPATRLVRRLERTEGDRLATERRRRTRKCANATGIEGHGRARDTADVSLHPLTLAAATTTDHGGGALILFVAAGAFGLEADAAERSLRLREVPAGKARRAGDLVKAALLARRGARRACAHPVRAGRGWTADAFLAYGGDVASVARGPRGVA